MWMARYSSRVAVAAILAVTGSAASAQDVASASTEADGAVEDIVVTAQRRETTLQQTPIAISAFSADSLEQRGIDDVRDLALYTPGLNIAGRSQLGATPVTLRGVTGSNSGPGLEDPVAIYLNDVYLARPYAGVFDLINVERVEVLRGPQGTLYGRNATGGAIRIITRRPGNVFSARGDIRYGRFNDTRVRASVTMPLVDNILSATFSGVVSERDGYSFNVTRNERQNDERTRFASAAIRFTPDDRWDILLNADYSSNHSSFNGKQIAGSGLADLGINPAVPATVPAPLRPYLGMPNQFIVEERDVDLLYGGAAVTERRSGWGTDLQINYALDGATVTSISAYREARYFGLSDGDATPAIFSQLDPASDDQRQFSQELRIASDGGGPFQWVVGGYLFHERTRTRNFVRLNLFTPVPFFPSWPNTDGEGVTFDATNRTNAYAGFVDASYDFGRLTLTAGLRYSRETKDDDDFQSLVRVGRDGVILGEWRPSRSLASLGPLAAFGFVPFGLLAGNVVPLAPGAALPSYSDSRTWEAWTPRLVVDYQAADDILLYASVSRGFKSGGYSITEGPLVLRPTGTGVAPPVELAGSAPAGQFALVSNAFEPETLWSYEAGIKSDLFDRRLRLNASAFFYDYTNLQVRVADAIGFLSNANADARLFGFEVEANARPTRELGLNATLAFLDSEYRNYGAKTGNPLINAPRWTLGFGADYEIGLADNRRIVLYADYQYSSRAFYTDEALPIRGRGAINIFNARATLFGEDDRWSLSIYGRNLTNERYRTQVLPILSAAQAIYNLPRTYGVELGFNF